MDQRLQALIGIYSEYCKFVDKSEPVLNDILKWVKAQVQEMDLGTLTSCSSTIEINLNRFHSCSL